MKHEALNKKLAEWAGFRRIRYQDCEEGEAWGYPDSSEWDYEKDLPNFPESLDACFKWLMPKLTAFLATQPIGCPSIVAIYAWIFARWLKKLNEEPNYALALCLATEKLIDKGEG